MAADTAMAGDDFEEHTVGEVEFMTNHHTGDFNVGVGGEEWVNDYCSGRFGVALMGVSKKDGLYGTAYAGMRVSAPFVVSPFVGLGVAIGRGYDKDVGDGYDRHPAITINGEDTHGLYRYIAVVYPEAGVRIWLGRRSSLVASVRYFMSTTGRANDSFMYGGGLTVQY